jgi:hypothetical protein
MARRLPLIVLLAASLASTAVAASGDTERRAITARDQAWAKRINLTLRDLPAGFRQGPPRPKSTPGSFTCPGFSPDLSRFTITGEAQSRQFVRADGTAVFSAAEIFRSVGDQRGDWALTARREALLCLRRVLTEGVARAATVTATMRPAPRLGDRAVSFRATITVVVGGGRAKLWLDLFGVARGRGDVTLGVVSVRRPPAAALERSLLAKLAARLSR